MRTEFKLYKVDIKYIRNLHKIDDKVLSVSPQTGKDNRVFVGIEVICGVHNYCIPLSSPKEKHKKIKICPPSSNYSICFIRYRQSYK